MKRALQAWSQYRVSGKQPAELYEASQPKKRTLASMWGLHVASEGSRKQAKLTPECPACNIQHDNSCTAQISASLQGASSADFQAMKKLDSLHEDASPALLKAAEPLASCHMGLATAVYQRSDNMHTSALAKVDARKDAAQASKGLDAQTAESDVEVLDSRHASALSRIISSGRPQSSCSADQERAAYPAEPCKDGSSHSAECITTSSRAAVQSGHGKGAAPANALSVLMATSKATHIDAASPQSGKKARPKGPAPQAHQQSSWKDALRQVALDPERCAWPALLHVTHSPTNAQELQPHEVAALAFLQVEKTLY